MANAVITTTKSPWYSTVNWVQVVGSLASIAIAVGAPINPEQIAQAVVGIQALVAVYTVIKHTFFEPQVLTPSAAVLPVVN